MHRHRKESAGELFAAPAQSRNRFRNSRIRREHISSQVHYRAAPLLNPHRIRQLFRAGTGWRASGRALGARSAVQLAGSASAWQPDLRPGVREGARRRLGQGDPPAQTSEQVHTKTKPPEGQLGRLLYPRRAAVVLPSFAGLDPCAQHLPSARRPGGRRG
jgi:hypothetical protein